MRNGIAASVTIFKGVGPGCFKDHDSLTGNVCDLFHGISKILESSVPVRIIGSSEDIVVHIFFRQMSRIFNIIMLGI